MSRFRDPEFAREAGRRGALAKHAKDRAARGHPPPPFAGTILDAMDAAGLTGPSWDAWRTFWRAVFALPFEDADRARFARHTGRSAPPPAPVREAWVACGRRGGKSRNAAVAAAFLAVRRDHAPLLAPGDRAVIPVIAADRRQAGQVIRYLRGLARTPWLAPYVGRVLKESVEFRTGAAVEVHTASYRTTRGFSVAALIADEISFWKSDETGANPDREILAAIKPGMLNMPGALLLALSSPYARRGELHRAHARFFGQDDARVLVWNSDTASMNPAADAAEIAEAFAEDPASAAAEYGREGRVEFRRDVQALVDPETVAACVVAGRRELPPMREAEYLAFADPAGGSGGDAYTLAIAHGEGEPAVAVIDAVREVRPPFSPDVVTAEYAALLRRYRVAEVTGDRYAGAWPREAFARHGVRYMPSTLTKSDLYREVLPLLNAGRVELPDVPRLAAQLAGLERRVARGAADSIDHAPGGRDDLANAVAGAAVLAAAREEYIPFVFL